MMCLTLGRGDRCIVAPLACKPACTGGDCDIVLLVLMREWLLYHPIDEVACPVRRCNGMPVL